MVVRWSNRNRDELRSSARTRASGSTWALVLGCLLLAWPAALVGQTPVQPLAGGVGHFHIAGIIVSAQEGRPLSRARVSLQDVKNRQNQNFIITGDDGHFEFLNLPAGKYSLTGAKRGYISAAYDQHEQFSTAIVTGAGVDTESLTLRLVPTALLTGHVFDESGEPVREATVTLWRDDHSAGVSRTVSYRTDQSDDLGSFEFAPLDAGTYFVSAVAKPWYAVHPPPPPLPPPAAPPPPPPPPPDRPKPARLGRPPVEPTQYTSWEYTQRLRDAGIAPSRGRTGTALDNAMAESVIATIKTELTKRRAWPTRLDLELALLTWIGFYNERRIHRSHRRVPSAPHTRHRENQVTTPARNPGRIMSAWDEVRGGVVPVIIGSRCDPGPCHVCRRIDRVGGRTMCWRSA